MIRPHGNNVSSAKTTGVRRLPARLTSWRPSWWHARTRGL
jgi:hypothetical protein